MKKYCKALVNLGVAFPGAEAVSIFCTVCGRLDHCVDRQSPGEVF